MVVFNLATASCEVYEIKHSAEIVPEQSRHLIDPDKCAVTVHGYGLITRSQDYRQSRWLAQPYKGMV